jgi:hypothetical protein
LRKKYAFLENECQREISQAALLQNNANLLKLSEQFIGQKVWKFYDEIENNILDLYGAENNDYVNMVRSGSKGNKNHLSTI